MIHVVGHTATDHICRVIDLPPRNGSTQILDHRCFFGGGAANVAAGIAILGGEVTLHSVVGGDFPGGEYDRWMRSLGIVQAFFTVPDAHTATAFMFSDGTGDQVTFFEWGASSAFRDQEAPSLPFVHLATADPAFNVRVAQKAEEASFDPGQDLYRYSAGDLREILGHISILFANRHEVAGMCRILGCREEDLIAGVRIAVFTSSASGSVLHTDGASFAVPAIPVTMADPTGAGDAYRAGFLTAYRAGYLPLACCRIGSVVASFAVEREGCQTNLPDWERMSARYQEHFERLDGR
jgi:sugar/nucleoside kinase (ribokinase family)